MEMNMGIILNLTGQRFSRLIVESKHPVRSLDGSTRWNCLCDCGNKTVVITSSLTSNHTTSCGCYRKERISASSKTHGMTRTTEYNIWSGMIQRCTNPNNEAYDRYAGRGITVCDRWLNSFEAFYEDMGPRPSPDHSIDRKENDKGYYKDNCRWATDIEQANNTRSNVFIEETKLTLAQTARENNVDYKLLHNRLRNGLSLEDAISQPIKQAKKYTHDGQTLTLSEWSEKVGIKIATLEYRLRNNWNYSDIFGQSSDNVHRYNVNGGNYTISELSKLFNIPAWKLRQRLHRDGMSIEDAVTRP